MRAVQLPFQVVKKRSERFLPVSGAVKLLANRFTFKWQCVIVIFVLSQNTDKYKTSWDIVHVSDLPGKM
jgi:hypothetical protein